MSLILRLLTVALERVSGNGQLIAPHVFHMVVKVGAIASRKGLTLMVMHQTTAKFIREGYKQCDFSEQYESTCHWFVR